MMFKRLEYIKVETGAQILVGLMIVAAIVAVTLGILSRETTVSIGDVEIKPGMVLRHRTLGPVAVTETAAGYPRSIRCRTAIGTEQWFRPIEFEEPKELEP